MEPTILLLMGLMFLGWWLVNHMHDYRCPGCGARDEKSHHTDCHFRDY